MVDAVSEAEKISNLMLLQAGQNITDLSIRREIRGVITEAEKAIMVHPNRVEPPQEVNHFADHMYARELHMPAGMVITSKIHKTNHFLFVMKGKAIVIDENHGREEIEAPCLIKTIKGTKRIWKVLEDLVIITTHATEHTDIAKIEQEIIAEDHLDTLEAEI